MTFVVVISVLLIAYSAAINLLPFPRLWYVPANLAVAVVVVFAARTRGVSWRELGFGRDGVAPGLRWGGVLLVIVAAGLAVGLALPAAERLFADRRVAGMSEGELAYQTLLRIPVGTALVEEALFRGALYGMLLHRYRTGVAVVGSSIAFGFWHIGPAFALIDTNGIGGAPAIVALLVAGAVVGTTIAGVILAALRQHTRGIVGPVLVHAGTNALATAAAFWAQRP